MYNVQCTIHKNKSEKLPVSAIILAGGKGERIGGNKLFLSVGGIYLVESLIVRMSFIFDEVLLCVGKGESDTVLNTFSHLTRFYSVGLVEDRSSERGPIEGLYTGLNAMSNEWGFLIGCDMPSPQEMVIRHMWSRTVSLCEEYKVTAARYEGHIMPRHAFYHEDCSYYISSLIEQVESDCEATENEKELQDLGIRSFNRKLNLKSFYCQTKVNLIEENDLAEIPGWRRSFAGYNTENELYSMIGF
jgi:molybdopterin-guanine dinucleotide biosynthesis protein A